MESTAAVETLEAVEASVAALAVVVRRGTGNLGATGADPLRDQADACLDGLAEVARVEARMAALKVHLAAGYAHTAKAMAAPAVSPQENTAQDMAMIAEVACVLTVSERSAGALLAEARTLTTTLPLTLSALQAGRISWQHARVMVDETTNHDRVGASGLEAHFLDPDTPTPGRGCQAGDLVPARFRAKARTWRERHHPVSIEKRHSRSLADRRVEYAPDRDGMAWLSAYLPASQAAGIWDRTTTAARALQGADEVRTLTQLRADITATWLLTAGRERTPAGTTHGTMDGSAMDGAGDGNPADGALAGHVPAGDVPSPAAQVLITVPVLSLLGLTEEPAMLDGYGPVPPSMGRALVADGASSFLRVLTDPRDGAPLEIGRTSYRIPKALRQWLRLRDGKCPFPGCNSQSLDNDADHVLAWARGGTTGISNLGQPCPKHHRLRHATAWTPTGANAHEPPGWTSPTGRRYPSEQPDWEPPRWPNQILAMANSFDTAIPEGSPPNRDRCRDLAVLGNLRPEDRLPDWDLPRQPHDDALAEDPFADLWLLLASEAREDSQDCAAPAQAAA
jgi:hypothetical protein